MSNQPLYLCGECGKGLPQSVFSFCPTCGALINDTTFADRKKKLPHDFRKIIRAPTSTCSEIIHGMTKKMGKAPKILRKTITGVAHDSSDISSNIVRNLAADIDVSFEKIQRTNRLLNRISESANDPKVATVAKSLRKHSPQIAIAIATYALAGIPYGTLIAQVSGMALQQVMQGEKDGSMSSQDQYSSANEITEIIVKQLIQKNKKESEQKVCIKCGCKLITDAVFCMKCGCKQD